MRIKNILIGISLLIVLAMITIIIVKVVRINKSSYNVPSSYYHTNIVKAYPNSGEGVATTTMPIRAYLDPKKSYVEINNGLKAKFVLASNPNIYFICNEKMGEETRHLKQDWWTKPIGNYLIYPYGSSEIYVFWHI